jgi:hypothetical protein
MLPLEKALFAVPRSDRDAADRDAAIVARHYGFDGRGGANFQRIGNEFELTRERVRQIVSQSDPRTHIMPGGLPALDRVIAAVTATLPAPAADIEKKLHSTGLTMKPFRIEGIASVAALVSRPLPFRINVLRKTRYCLPDAWPQFREIVNAARNQVRRNGMATISQLMTGQPVDNGVGGEQAQRDAVMIETILALQPDFRWLDREHGWFWLAQTSRNCAVTRIRKMLAVANPLPVSEIRAGLGRMGSPLAPELSLLELCRQIEGLSVRADVVYADPGIETADVLNKTELEIFQLLSEHNGCMSNLDLISQSSLLGMKRPTFYQCVTCSPIVSRYNGRDYRLIGSGQSVRPPRSEVAIA